MILSSPRESRIQKMVRKRYHSPVSRLTGKLALEEHGKNRKKGNSDYGVSSHHSEEEKESSEDERGTCPRNILLISL